MIDFRKAYKDETEHPMVDRRTGPVFRTLETSALANGGKGRKGGRESKNEQYGSQQDKSDRKEHRRWRNGRDLVEEQGKRAGNENETLSRDIETILSPCMSLEDTDTRLEGRVTRYFAFLVILVPSIIGILAPPANPNISANIDLANLVTDSLMVLVVSWFINFTIEWPWSWYKKILQAKYKLMANSSAFISKVSCAELANNHILTKRLLAVKRLSTYENYSLALCFVCTCMGAAIMGWSRNYISIEDARKKLVFSNLNITLFLFLEIFRLIFILTEKLQKHTVNDIKDKIANDNMEYGIITEENLDLFLPLSATTEGHGKSGIMNILVSLANTVKVNFHVDDEACYQKKLDVLRKESYEQSELMKCLMRSQSKELSKLNLSMTKLEDSLISINKDAPLAIRNKESVFLNPFPLNLNSRNAIGSNNESKRLTSSILADTNRQPMHTIFEESDLEEAEVEGSESKQEDDMSTNEQEDEHQDPERASLPKSHRFNSDFTTPTSYPESIFDAPLLDPNSMNQTNTEKHTRIHRHYSDESQLEQQKNFQSNHFSLHGLPSSSTIKNLVTRKSVFDDIDYEPYPNSIHLGHNINNLVGYSSEQLSLRSNMEINNFGLLSKLKQIIKRVLQNVSLMEVLKNPLIVRHIINYEVVPILLTFSKQQLEIYYQTTQLLNNMLWELSTKYIFLILQNFALAISAYLKPLERIKDFVILVYVKLPLNILRFYAAIITFIPKIIYHSFIVYPILLYKRQSTNQENNKPQRSDHNVSETKPFLGMKQFHLASHATNHSSGNGLTHNKNHDLRTRKLILKKLAKHYDIGHLNNTNDRFTPVELYDER